MSSMRCMNGLGAAIGAMSVLSAAILSGSARAAETLVVYTAMAEERLPVCKASFEKANPGILIEWLRSSAMQQDFAADAVWGLPLTNLLMLDQGGRLQSYRPAGYDQIKDDFKDTRTGWPNWVGMDAWSSAICFNPALAATLNLTPPRSWLDLTNPSYKGQVAMPDPKRSSVGFLTVAGWMQIFGGSSGWDFMDMLDQNVTAYPQSGAKPCADVSAGAYPVGISALDDAIALKAKGAPIEIILPTDGLGWEMEAAAILKGSAHLAAAKALADFASSADASRLYRQSFNLVAREDISKELPPNYPAEAETLLLSPNDFYLVAEKRQATIDQWMKRFGAKVAP